MPSHSLTHRAARRPFGLAALAIAPLLLASFGAHDSIDPVNDDAGMSSDPHVSCPTIDWAPSLEEAFELAKKERKPVMIAFSARIQESGCGGEF